MMQSMTGRQGKAVSGTAGRLAGWLLARLRHAGNQQPRLTMLERIAIAPRHSLALVEADGRRLLVATSADSAPVFYALDPGRELENTLWRRRRISW